MHVTKEVKRRNATILHFTSGLSISPPYIQHIYILYIIYIPLLRLPPSPPGRAGAYDLLTPYDLRPPTRGRGGWAETQNIYYILSIYKLYILGSNREA